MFYAFILKKNKGDIAPFAVSTIINKYAAMFNNDIVISSPGYMSTTISTITDFVNNLKLTQNVYFAVGMNGNQAVNGKSYVSIQDEYNNQYGSKLKMKKFSSKDHSKFMFFLDAQSGFYYSLKVKAILIGSSNQSYSTYFKSPAEKGETDVFIIDGTFIDKNDESAEKRLLTIYDELDQNIKECVLLTKEISEKNPNYLNDIFIKTMGK